MDETSEVLASLAGVPFWYDPAVFSGCVALSFIMPQKLPMDEGLLNLPIDADFLRIHGAPVEALDTDWASLPFSCLLYLQHLELRPNPMHADALRARDFLRQITGVAETNDAVKALADDAPGRTRTAVAVLVPVRSRAAAFRPPRGKIDIVTVVQWILSDLVRTLRISTGAALRDVPYEMLTPVVPASFASGSDWASFQFEAKEQTLVLPHIAGHVDGDEDESRRRVEVGFFELSRGSIHMVIRDHISAGVAAATQGDRRSAVVSFAIACELFLDSLLAALLWEEGKTPEEAVGPWRAPSVVRRVKLEYATRIGGSWNPNKPGPLADWLTHVVNVRNSVLHSGRSPDDVEVERSSDAAGVLTNHLARRLVLSWQKYPKTMAVFVGHKSVAEHASKKRADDIHRSLDVHSAHAVSFHAWRDEWLAVRAADENAD